MASVNATEKVGTPAPAAPNRLPARAPATAPPPVLAIVLSDSTAAIGRSTWRRMAFRMRPDGRPARSSASIRLAGTE